MQQHPCLSMLPISCPEIEQRCIDVQYYDYYQLNRKSINLLLIPGKCSNPSPLLIWSLRGGENCHLLNICASLNTSQIRFNTNILIHIFHTSTNRSPQIHDITLLLPNSPHLFFPNHPQIFLKLNVFVCSTL